MRYLCKWMDLAPEALILRGDQQDHSMLEFAWTADLNGVWQEHQQEAFSALTRLDVQGVWAYLHQR